LYRQAAAPTLERGGVPGEDTMLQYIQTMMRNEPITFIVMLLMIAILAFGVWDFMHVVKR
jgi:hypothetical protein